MKNQVRFESVWKKLLFPRIDRRHAHNDNKEPKKKKSAAVPCTALPADIAAISTGVDWFFNHSSICFFFSVTISPMPMLIAPRARSKRKNSFLRVGEISDDSREEKRVLKRRYFQIRARARRFFDVARIDRHVGKVR